MIPSTPATRWRTLLVLAQAAEAEQDYKHAEQLYGDLMKQVPGGPAGWLAYVHVDDIRATTDRVKGLGGKVMKDVTEIPNMGWLSIIQDPTGVVLGLWKPKM